MIFDRIFGRKNKNFAKELKDSRLQIDQLLLEKANLLLKIESLENRSGFNLIGFDKAFEASLELEGGYVNDPQDPGGETKYGISKRYYPNLDIKNLTQEQAKLIYKKNYWDKMKLYKMDDEVGAEIFDTGINMGRGSAVRIAQKSLNFLGENLIIDGIIGKKTINALNKWSNKDKRAVLVVLNGFQFLRYLEIIEKNPKLEKFARGWTKRVSF